LASKLRERVPAFDQRHYVPCVRWKQGEYQAILRLMLQTGEGITPLIEIPEVGWDFERCTAAKTVQEHLAPFAKRVDQKWGARPCFVDLKLLDPADRMLDGTHPVDYVFDELRQRRCCAVPVTGPDRDSDYHEAIGAAIQRDRRGVCLRLNLTEAVDRNVHDTVDGLLQELKTDPVDTDLVLDLDAPANFVPIEGFVKLLEAIVVRLPHRDSWRTFTLLGASFPKTMGVLRVGSQSVKRYEWLAYKRLTVDLSNAQLRLPTFGDYGISHPEVLRMDMRKVKPAASIRYTVDDAWYVLKGKNVRDYKFEQYRALCAHLASSPHFAGRDRSRGDAYIEDCANGAAKTGNLTTWRWVGTNHHIEKVVFDIANWFAP